MGTSCSGAKATEVEVLSPFLKCLECGWEVWLSHGAHFTPTRRPWVQSSAPKGRGDVQWLGQTGKRQSQPEAHGRLSPSVRGYRSALQANTRDTGSNMKIVWEVVLYSYLSNQWVSFGVSLAMWTLFCTESRSPSPHFFPYV